MPNLIITKNCNLNCDYCFAGVNYSWQKLEMSFALYVLYLKHLYISWEQQIRLIGWEPLLHGKVRDMLLLWIKSWFDIIVFSNLTLPITKIEKIFKGIWWKITVNINVNKKSFYKPYELDNLYKNIETLNKNNIKIKISYLVYTDPWDEKFIMDLAYKYNIKEIHLKPYNYNGMTKFDTGRLSYGNDFYNIISKYGNDFQFFISCGFSHKILSLEKKEELETKFNIKFKFWCSANGWKYDIDYDGRIFRCFALEDKFKLYNFNLYKLYNLESGNIKKMLNGVIDNQANRDICLWYKTKL